MTIIELRENIPEILMDLKADFCNFVGYETIGAKDR